MTTARNLLVDPHTPGFFHCISRCARRAWLCGTDSYNGKSYEYRREWVEQRLLELAGIFAVGWLKGIGSAQRLLRPQAA